MADLAGVTKKAGHVDIKQSSKVKGRKLKAWRRRWVVVTKMTDHASHAVAAKVDIYPDDPAREGQGRDRVTFVLENVTAVQQASSKTHPFAFEIVEAEPVLVVSGHSEAESNDWISALRHIFFSDGQVADCAEHFAVTILKDTESQRLGLNGHYTLRITTEGVVLLRPRLQAVSDKLAMSPPKTTPPQHFPGLYADGVERKVTEDGDVVVIWRLPMLRRFNVEKGLFVLNCGPNSPKGEAIVRFVCDDPNAILTAMRKSISVALAARQRTRQTAEIDGPRSRTDSVMTVNAYQGLLERSQKLSAEAEISEMVQDSADSGGNVSRKELTLRLRSGSQSSSASTIGPVSPTSSTVSDAAMSGADNASSDLDSNEPPALSMKKRVSVHSVGSANASKLSSSPSTVSDVLSSSGGSQRHMGTSPIDRIHEVSENLPDGSSSVSNLSHSGKIMDPRTVDFDSASSVKTGNPVDVFGNEFQQQQEAVKQQILMWQQQQQMQQMHKGSPLLVRHPQAIPMLQHPATSNFLDPRQMAFWQQAQQQSAVLPPKDQLQWWMMQQQIYLMQQQQQQLQAAWNQQGLLRNASFPHDIADLGTDGAARDRTSSLDATRPRASGSICSGDSGVVVTERSRKGSNSFDSAVSVDSLPVTHGVSDMADILAPSPEENKARSLPGAGGVHHGAPSLGLGLAAAAAEGSNKSTPSGSSTHIYQDLDSVRTDGTTKAYRTTSSSSEGAGLGRRRHSTGDMRKENDYDEIKKVAPAVSSVFVDTPPKLPERPAYLAQGKTKTMAHRSRFTSALSIFTGVKTLKEKKAKPSSLEQLTSADDRSRSPVTLSRAGSADLYYTIRDDGERGSRSNHAPPAKDSSSPPSGAEVSGRPAVAPRLAVDTGIRADSNKDPASPSNAAQGLSQNLLTFSDSDLTLTGGGSRGKATGRSGGGPYDVVIDSKAALIDFFLNDATFHANPMVTGQLKAGGTHGSGATAATSGVSTFADSFGCLSLPPAATSNWARFSDQPTLAQPDPWFPAAPTSYPPPLAAPLGVSEAPPQSAGGITARVEGVYIDMRKSREDLCEYVAPSEVLTEKDRDFLDFFLLQ